ncbi:hypothetical protein Chor_011629 [Crotalus horridus]
MGEFSVFDVTSDSVHLYWTVSTGRFDSFLIQYKDADGQPQMLPVEGGSREITVTKLAPSRRYKFNLYGVLGRKRSTPLSTDATTAHIRDTGEPIPVQPNLGDFSVLEVTSDSVRLHWTVPTGSFDSFLIQYKDADGQPQALPVEGNLNEATVTNLAPLRRYKFNLYGVSGRKRSSPLSTDATTAQTTDSGEAIPVQPTLGELSVLDITSNSVRLHWTVPAGTFDSFLVQYKDADGQPQVLPVEGGSREVTVSNLAPSHRYKFLLYGVSGRKKTSVLSADAFTDPSSEAEDAIPVQPRLGELSILDVTSDSVRLHWTVPTGSFDSFLIHYKDADGQPQTLPVEGDSREVTVTELVPSHTYKFNLYGVSGHKRSSPLSTDATTAHLPDSEQPIPVQPSLGQFSVMDVTSNSVRLHWTVPTGSFDSFLIQYKDAEGQAQMLPVEGGTNEVTVTNLVPSRRYKFNLYGVSGRKRSSPLSTDATTARLTESEDQIPVQPSLGDFTVLDVTSDSVRLHWTVPTGTFDSFLVQYKDADGQPQALPVEGNSREVTVTELVPSRRYKFNLYGVSGRKRSGPLSTDATTTAHLTDSEETNPAQPSLGEFSVLEVTSDSVHLHWTVPTGSFDSFLIQYKDADGQPQALPVEGDSREVTVTNLAPSRRYKFNLYGISGRKRSSPLSTDATIAPDRQDPVIPPSLGEVSASEITSSSVRLSWTVLQGRFDSFAIQYKDAEGQPQAVPVEGDLPEPEEKKEEDKDGENQPSLGKLSIFETTSNSLRLSWSVPTGSFDSFLIQYEDGALQSLPVDGVSRETLVSNLTPSHNYQFDLYGISGGKRLGPISAEALTAPPSPSQDREESGSPGPSPNPSFGDLSVSDVTSNSVRLSWNVPAETFDSFQIQYKDAENKPQMIPVDKETNTIVIYYLVEEKKQPEESTGKSTQPNLGNVTVSEVTPDSLLLSWNVQEGNFDSFIIQYKDAAGKPQAVPVDGSMRSLHLYNLTPSQTYEFDVFGVSGYKHLGPLSIHTMTEISEGERTVQPQLGDLSVSRVTNDSVALFWTVAAGNFDSFLLQYKDSEGKPQVLPLKGTSRDIAITSLTPSHRYKFNLYGLNGRKRLGPVSTNVVTGQGTQPLKLGTLSTHNITSESLLLSWTVESGNFDSFIIQYRDAAGKSHALPVDGGLRLLRFHDLVPSHRYKFNLYGVSGRKRLGPIPVEAVTVSKPSGLQVAPQPKLGKLFASNVSDTSLRLTWRVLTGKFESFSVEYRDAEGKTQVSSVDTNARDVVISNLVPSHRYKFNLYGISQQKRFGPVSTEAVTAQVKDSEAKLKLGDLSISGVTNDSVRLSWTVSSGRFDSFLIRYKDAQGKPQTVPVVTSTTLHLSWDVPEGEFDSFIVRWKDNLGSGQTPVPAKEVKVPGDERSITLQGLAPSTEYSLTVYGIKDESEVADINTGAKTSGLELDGPQDLRFSDIHETSVVTNWSPPSSRIDGYKVSFQPSDGGEPKSISVDGSELRALIGGLTPGTSYEVAVMSIRGFEESEPLVGYVTTVPDGPSDLRAVNVTDTSAVLTWHPAVAEMNNYIVTYGPITGTVCIPSHTPPGSQVSESVPGNRVQLQLSELQRDMEYWANEIPLDASVTSYELQDLIPSSRYQVQVQAVRRDTPTAPISTSFTTGLSTSDERDESVYATYQNFRVDPPADYYRLHLGSYRGTAGDALSYHSGSVFSTRDRDPNRVIIPCAISYRGAWWYRNCHYTNLNGLYANNRDHQAFPSKGNGSLKGRGTKTEKDFRVGKELKEIGKPSDSFLSQ